MNIFYILSFILVFYLVMEHIATKSKSKRTKFIRSLFWKSKRNRIIKFCDNPLISFPLSIFLTLDTTAKDAYINKGTDALIETVTNYLDNFISNLTTPKKRGIQESISFMKNYREQQNTLTEDEDDFITNYLKNNPE